MSYGAVEIVNQRTRYRVTGMDCPSCAAKIEKAIRSIGINDARVSIATQILTLGPDIAQQQLAEVEQAVTAIGYRLDELPPGEAEAGEAASREVHVSPQYKKALWVVILLNVGFGIIEMIGGMIAGSQALKADALDFLGDGLITFLGVLAIGWSLAWRAISAYPGHIPWRAGPERSCEHRVSCDRTEPTPGRAYGRPWGDCTGCQRTGGTDIGAAPSR